MLQEKRVVTCFLESDGEILILRRSEQVGTYQGRWAGVSGYIETNADEQALVEIEEETSLCREDFELIKRGKPLSIAMSCAAVKKVIQSLQEKQHWQ